MRSASDNRILAFSLGVMLVFAFAGLRSVYNNDNSDGELIDDYENRAPLPIPSTDDGVYAVYPDGSQITAVYITTEDGLVELTKEEYLQMLEKEKADRELEDIQYGPGLLTPSREEALDFS